MLNEVLHVDVPRVVKVKGFKKESRVERMDFISPRIRRHEDRDELILVQRLVQPVPLLIPTSSGFHLSLLLYPFLQGGH